MASGVRRDGGLQRFKASAAVGAKQEVKFYLFYQQVLRRVKFNYTPTIFFPPSQVNYIKIPKTIFFQILFFF